jgi:hypothetical protein
MGFGNATMAYYEEDYLEHAEFWDGHKQLAAKVTAVRKGFRRDERTFLHGFSSRHDGSPGRSGTIFGPGVKRGPGRYSASAPGPPPGHIKEFRGYFRARDSFSPRPPSRPLPPNQTKLEHSGGEERNSP